MKVIYKQLKLEVPKDVYKPAEDTFLLADNLEVETGEKILELGTGCGLLSIIAAKRGAKVTSTDINPKAVKCAKENAESEGVLEKIDFRRGNLFEPIKNGNFDLIIFNPPYLPVPESESLEEKTQQAWDGGLDGRKIIDKFLEGVENHLKPRGRSSFVQSSLTGFQETKDKLKQKNFEVNIKTEKTFFEELYLFQVTKKN